eukprot:jgi/Botrbrau1/17467/Bobra.0054s0054.1
MRRSAPGVRLPQRERVFCRGLSERRGHLFGPHCGDDEMLRPQTHCPRVCSERRCPRSSREPSGDYGGGRCSGGGFHRLPRAAEGHGRGGGIGIYICNSSAEVRSNFASAGRLGEASFGDSGVFVEKYVERAHHIEVQIFGDGKGLVVTLPERECSIQRRHQKIVEETPSPNVDEEVRGQLMAAARRLGRPPSTAPRVPWNSSWTATPTSSTFWKSTRASRWSTGSQSWCPEWTWWTGCCSCKCRASRRLTYISCSTKPVGTP